MRAIGFLSKGVRVQVKCQPLKPPGELPPDPADEKLHQLLVVHVQKLVEVDSTVSKLTESPPLLKFSIIGHGEGFASEIKATDETQILKFQGSNQHTVRYTCDLKLKEQFLNGLDCPARKRKHVLSLVWAQSHDFRSEQSSLLEVTCVIGSNAIYTMVIVGTETSLLRMPSAQLGTNGISIFIKISMPSKCVNFSVEYLHQYLR